MNNEETRLINEDEPINTINPVNNTQGKKSDKGKTVAAAGGGFVAGVAMGVGGSAFAGKNEIISEVDEPEKESEEVNEQGVREQLEDQVPEPEQVLLANNEGIRFAHVDADNFADAFAQAREQVGPGGAFEYDGRIYGTYYADEWGEMSNEERVDFQNRVNGLPLNAHNTPTLLSVDTVEVETTDDVDPIDGNLISDEPIEAEINVLGVEAVMTDDGTIMNVALVESGGDHALLVDVNNDGVIDALIHDDNGNGGIEPEEIHDVADAGFLVDDLRMAQAAHEGEYLAASDDGMPDYINDADTIMEA